MFTALRRPLQALAILIALGIPVVVLAQTPIDLNSATSEQLQTLPGIGPAKAGAIVEYREVYGAFARIEDITNVSGIGDATFDRLRDLITVGATSAEPVAPVAPAAFDDTPTIDLRDEPGDNANPNPAPSGQSDRPASGQSSPPDTPSDAGALININTADAETLRQLPGIGETKASAIIEHRTANGPFQSVEQLDDVPGIGPATLERIRPLVTL